MAGLFHLQINLISMLFSKFWGVAANMVSLNGYNNILKRKHIYKKPDNNNFHHTDEFFHILIEAIVVTLCMHIAGYSTIDELQTWIGKSDWPALIGKVECDYLGIFTLQCIQDEVSIKTNITVVSMLETKKREWLKSDGHQQVKPNWIVVEKGFFLEISTKTRNIIQKNALSLFSYGLLYLDFADAY